MKFFKALKDTFPIFVSYFALSFSFGILAVKMGLNPIGVSITTILHILFIKFLLEVLFTF